MRLLVDIDQLERAALGGAVWPLVHSSQPLTSEIEFITLGP